MLLIGDGNEVHTSSDIAAQVEEVSKTVPSSILAHTFIFDATPDRNDWPPDTHLILRDGTSAHHQLANIRDSLIDFSNHLFKKLNRVYICTRERFDVKSPYDPASELIQTQFSGMSAHALTDPQINPPPSPPPSQESQQRSSLGPGIMASAERLRVLSTGRALKLCGDLLLACGFCTEALRHYSDAAAIAKVNNDYLWYGAALEGIGACLVVSAFLNVNWQIPTVAQSSSYRNSESRPGAEAKTAPDLVDFLPDLQATILGAYQKSAMTQSDRTPPLVQAESVLRLAYLLATVHICGGLNRASLDHLVIGTTITKEKPRTSLYPPRAEIAAWAMRAHQESITFLSLADKAHIYSGLASVLGTIKFLRRRSFFLRELMLALLPALVQARVTGAAGLGIHPAASLALSESQTNNFAQEVLRKTRQSSNSLISLLEDVAQSYGLPRYGDMVDLEETVLGGYGWPSLRNAVLKDCMAICEAIPDFEEVLKFSARILESNSPNMDRDEQVRLVANIPRILGAAKRAGVTDLEVDYWDSYLIRDIVVEADMVNRPIQRRTREMLAVDATSVSRTDPFLYNPYLKKTSTMINGMFLVENEPANVSITLQNPFAFDVEAQEIKLYTQDVDATSTRVSAYIKARSTTTVELSCTANGVGSLRILGCRVTMAGCRSKAYRIQSTPNRERIEAWHVARGGMRRQKRVGTEARSSLIATNTSTSTLSQPEDLFVTVLPATPVLIFQAAKRTTSISATVFEGETSSCTISLQNISKIPVTFISFSFDDNTLKPLEQAITSRTSQPHDIYELENLLYNRKAIYYDATRQTAHVTPSASESFHISIYGKRGVTSAEVLVNYGYLPLPEIPSGLGNDSAEQEGPAAFYTRQLKIPVKFMVQPSLDIVHCDILPVSSPDALPRILQTSHQEFSVIHHDIAKEDIEDYCLMVLDLRNAQAQTVSFSLRCEDTDSTTAFQTTGLIHGTLQHRILVPMRRKYLSQAMLSRPIPSLSARQFVVSSVSPAQEAANREMFWARESLLGRLSLSWSIGEREGKVEERSIHLNRRMMETYLLPALSLKLTLVRATDAITRAGDLHAASLEVDRTKETTPSTTNSPRSRTHVVETGEEMIVRIVIVKRDPDAAEVEESEGIPTPTPSSNPADFARLRGRRMMLRLVASHDVLPDLVGQFIVLGTSQIPITVGEGAGRTEHEVRCIALATATYHLQASLVPIAGDDRLRGPQQPQQQQQGRVVVSRKMEVQVTSHTK